MKFKTSTLIGIILCATVIPAIAAVAAIGDSWLIIKGDDSAESAEYYAQINAPTTFADWQTLYFATGTEIEARYYNAGDLGFGREMHCKKGNNDDIACYVSNHGFGAASPVDRSLDAAIDDDLELAAVAMVYDVSRDGLANDVTFYVYDENGNRLNSVALDSEGGKAVPQLCLSCHGGNYDSATNAVNGASFLPFDTAAFKYSNRGGYRLSDQQDAFRRLNRLVKQSNPTPAITTLIDGWYASTGGITTTGATLNESYVPPAYDGNSSDRGVYLNAVKPFCRSCHVAQTFNLASPADLNAARDNLFPPPSSSPFVMPHAEQTHHNLFHGFDSNPVRATEGLKRLANHQGWSLRVTKTADTNDGACDNDCSLREAVIEANRAGNPSPAIITFNIDGVFQLTRQGEDNVADRGDLDLRRPMVIVGNDAGNTVISGNDIDRVFHIIGGADVTLMNLTIREGTPAGFYNYGGGIAMEYDPPDGGRIIFDYPKATLIAVDMRGNHVDGSTAVGGAIANIDGTLIIEQSSIGPNNRSGRNAGGIYNGRYLKIFNSTISGNRAEDKGGGLMNYAQGSTFLEHVTMSDNHAANFGGLVNLASQSGLTGDISIKASIVGGNHSPLERDCGNASDGTQFGTTSDSGYNRVGSNRGTGGCPRIASTTEMIMGPIDEVIQPNLTRGGNGVYYHALVSNGVAVDIIPVGPCGSPAYDQRNVARPLDGNGDDTYACDAGAVEGAERLQLVPIGAPFIDVLADDGRCVLREAVLAANSGVSSGKSAGECPGGVSIIELVPGEIYTLTQGALEIKNSITLIGNEAGIVQETAGERAIVVYEGGSFSAKDLSLRSEPTNGWVSQPVAAFPGLGGGGILILPGGMANLMNIAVSQFRSDGNGGGIMNYGLLNLANSTVSSNKTNGSGGGVGNVGIARLSLVTLADNVADDNADNIGDGGGFANNGPGYLANSIVARNLDRSSSTVFPDIAKDTSALVSGGNNVIGVDAGAADVLVASDVHGSTANPLDARLGPLIGSPPYHPLLSGSPAQGQVPFAACRFLSEVGNALFGPDAQATQDQMGRLRGVTQTTCDAGAIESHSVVLLPVLMR